MSASATVTPMPCRKPRFPKDQTTIAALGTVIHQLDAENSIIIINNAIADTTQLSTYIDTALAVERTSPMCGTPAGPVPIPRSQMCYTTTGKPYLYSKTSHDTKPFPPHVLALIQQLIHVFNETVPDNPYVHIDTAADLMYSSQQKNGGSISAHCDYENPKWGLVLIHTLGQARYIRIRRKDKSQPFINVKIDHNSLLAMYGPTFQSMYTHQVDKLKDGEEIGVRLSLNVRLVSDPSHII